MITVSCALIQKGKYILAVQRSETMKMPLKWEFPGGKVELHETAEDCLVREIEEELHLMIELKKRLKAVIYPYDNFTINLIPFTAKIKSGKLKLTEHKTYKWLLKEDLLRLDWADADIPIVKDFLNQN
ncbi:(deoxy)nucleoside triphosphate pyrophosphohydrolase [Echinicola soli]|uniref:8-oxo-dGTP diphosphatase n=1 Tax=Echinicola soli TaxID=2591634 RepID=A0A514CF00_9BACT|nr:(deoxy)nucleoside triphosphate pyrophosphohydrolase [Echinicola soli]QDH78402.1 (deoxy)nucleoside triphosphate pyrophosphohydrolase [Echinicola soli]